MAALKPESVWRRTGAFYLAGLSLSAACFLLLHHWLALARWICQDPDLIYEHQPGWLKGLYLAITALPWAMLVLFVLLRILRGKAVKPFAFALGVVTPNAAVMAYLFLWPVLEDRLHRQPFDAQAWRGAVSAESANSAWPLRLRMVDDLLERHPLQGMTRQQVVALLGEPGRTGSFRDWDMVYWLGPERGFIRIDSEWLLLRLDAGEKVVEYRIARD